jgi:hypothetical protein
MVLAYVFYNMSNRAYHRHYIYATSRKEAQYLVGMVISNVMSPICGPELWMNTTPGDA